MLSCRWEGEMPLDTCRAPCHPPALRNHQSRFPGRLSKGQAAAAAAVSQSVETGPGPGPGVSALLSPHSAAPLCHRAQAPPARQPPPPPPLPLRAPRWLFAGLSERPLPSPVQSEAQAARTNAATAAPGPESRRRMSANRPWREEEESAGSGP